MSSIFSDEQARIELSPHAYCRIATVDDLPKLEMLEHDTYGIHAAEPMATYAKRIEEFPIGSWVLEVNDELIGHCFFERWAEPRGDHLKLREELVLHQRSPWKAEHGNCLYLASLAIHTRYQRNGWGHWLFLQALTRVFEMLPSLATVSLVVAESNKTATSLYLKLGFHPNFKIRNGYYQDEPRRPVWFMSANREQLKLK